MIFLKKHLYTQLFFGLIGLTYHEAGRMKHFVMLSNFTGVDMSVFWELVSPSIWRLEMCGAFVVRLDFSSCCAMTRWPPAIKFICPTNPKLTPNMRWFLLTWQPSKGGGFSPPKHWGSNRRPFHLWPCRPSVCISLAAWNSRPQPAANRCLFLGAWWVNRQELVGSNTGFYDFIELQHFFPWGSSGTDFIGTHGDWMLQHISARKIGNSLVVSSIFYVHPYLGKWSNLTNIFQLGWNHQPGNSCVFSSQKLR